VSIPTEGPFFTGLLVHRDLRYRYSFLFTEGWHDYELESAGGRGRIFAPRPDDITTSFSVEARDLGTEVTGDDLATLRDGVEEGLQQLPELVIEKREGEAIGDLVTLEYWFTFREAETGEIRKRWLRLAYQGQIQVRLIAQGASPEEFTYWLPGDSHLPVRRLVGRNDRELVAAIPQGRFPRRPAGRLTPPAHANLSLTNTPPALNAGGICTHPQKAPIPLRNG